jgi:hypothetical protein
MSCGYDYLYVKKYMGSIFYQMQFHTENVMFLTDRFPSCRKREEDCFGTTGIRIV